MLLILSGDIHPCPGPDTFQEINNKCSGKGSKFLHENIRGLQGKYDEIKEILVRCKENRALCDRQHRNRF